MCFNQCKMTAGTFCVIILTFCIGLSQALAQSDNSSPDAVGEETRSLMLCGAFYNGLGRNKYGEFLLNRAIHRAIKNPNIADTLTPNWLEDSLGNIEKFLKSHLTETELTKREVYLFGIGLHKCPVMLGVEALSQKPDDTDPATKIANHAVCVVSAERLGSKQLADEHRSLGRKLFERTKMSAPSSFKKAVSEARSVYEDLSVQFHRSYVSRAC